MEEAFVFYFNTCCAFYGSWTLKGVLSTIGEAILGILVSACKEGRTDQANCEQTFIYLHIIKLRVSR